MSTFKLNRQDFNKLESHIKELEAELQCQQSEWRNIYQSNIDLLAELTALRSAAQELVDTKRDYTSTHKAVATVKLDALAALCVVQGEK